MQAPSNVESSSWRLFGSSTPPLFLTPTADDVDTAQTWLRRFTGNGIDGVIAKEKRSTYQPGRRAIWKVKVERTADCVVGGIRVFDDHPLVASLLLGLYDARGKLLHVGVASAFTVERRAGIYRDLRPLFVPLEDHPWSRGFGLEASPLGRLGRAAGRWTPELAPDWIPVRPERVCEVSFDQWQDDRFRHPTRFKHWRFDRDPESCTLDQTDVSPPAALGDLRMAS